MSHSWRKPINFIAGLVVVAGMGAFGTGVVSASSAHVRPALGKGTIIYSDYEKAPTLNPKQYNGVATAEQEFNIMPFGWEYYYDQNAKLQPGMFTKVPKPTNGGKTWTLTLRSGIKWSNGLAMTNKDLLFGWHVEMNSITGPACLGACDDIASMTLKGSTTVVIHLKTVSAVFLQQDLPDLMPYGWKGLGGNQSACLGAVSGCNSVASTIWNNKGFNYESKSDVTAGPYQVSSFSNGSLNDTVFTPNPRWKASWLGAKGVTPLSKLEYLQFGSQADMIAGAATGATDATTDYTVLSLPALRAADNHHQYKILTHASFDPENLFFNDYNKTVNIDGGPSNVKSPVYSVKVREALALAYNHAAMESNAYGIPLSLAKKYTTYELPFVSTPALRNPYADKSITGAWDPIRHKDVAAGSSQAFADAKTLLKQAGFAHPTIYITTNGSGNVARHNEVDYLASNAAWGKIGVHVVYIDKEAEDLFNDWNGGGLGPHGHFEIMIFAYTDNPPYPDGWYAETEGQFCAQTDKSGGAENDENWSCIHDSKVDHAFTAAAQTTNSSKRQKEFNIISTEFNKNVFWSPLAMRPVIHTADAHVGNASVNPFIGAAVNWDPWAWHFVS
jgi:ABC-type transport system substrate-binding protein